VNRPLLLRMVPDRLCIAIWARLYRSKQKHWQPLYRAATLRHGPLVSMELVSGDVISDCIAFTGVYEPVLTRRVVELARQGGTLIDIGANLGYFALIWAACNPANKCIAFEASPRNVDILLRNVNQNQFETQITVVPSPAGAAQGKLWFDIGPPDQTGWGGLTLEENEPLYRGECSPGR
jgi:hypothetical protein